MYLFEVLDNFFDIIIIYQLMPKKTIEVTTPLGVLKLSHAYTLHIMMLSALMHYIMACDVAGTCAAPYGAACLLKCIN